METGFSNLKEDIHELAARLDKKVSEDIYEFRHDTLMARVETLEKQRVADREMYQKDREADRQQRVLDRRWKIAAVAIPIVTIVIGAITAVVVAVVG
jgi:hypothetical protein